MYRHIKTNVAVNVGSPDARFARFGNVLLEQFGGANGELAAALAARGIRAENGKSLSLQN
jgi:Mn-containing catalase